jgi:oligopeptidase B
MRLGTPPEDDAVILREPDTRFRVSVSRTRSGRFLVLTCAASRSTEVHLLAADAPDSDPRLVAARQPEHEYSVTHQGERLLIRSNADGALNFKLMEAPEAGGPWTELVPHRDDVHLTGVTGFADWYVLQERESARRQVRVVDLKTGAAWVAPADETASVSWVGDNREYGARVLRYGYSSMKTPESVFEIDLDTRARAMRKRAPVLGGFAPDDYHSTRWEIPAPDGALIPVSVVWRGDATPPADAPTLLYGYGSYGMSVDPRFSSARLSLLDRGVVYAIAHIRGSSARGRAWYEAGRTAQKQNTFTDVIAVARALVDRGVTRPDRLAIRGGSAGGLLMGACMNQAPALFRAAVAQVPFVDVVSTMLDESIPLTTNEWEEWGDPRSREDFERMRAWSPYDNVAAAEYPALLITSGLNDPRVQYWEPTKWMARLRHRVTTRGPLLLKTHMGAGHGGKSGRYGRLEGEARTFGFLLDQLGLAD